MTITKPANGSVYRGASSLPNITWLSDANGGGRNFALSWSCDNGVTWKAIGTTANGDARSMAWTSTVADSTQCKIRNVTNGVTAINTFTIDSRPPAHVTNADAIGGNTTMSLSWTNPADTDFAGVRIYRTTTPGALGGQVATVLGTDVPNNSWTDTALTNGTTYYYHLVTFDSVPAGNGGPNSEESAYTNDVGHATARYGTATASNGNTLWTFGGYSGAAYLQDTWEFSPAFNIFGIKAATLPTVRGYTRAAYVGGAVDKVVLMGGYDGTSALTDIRKFDPTAGTLTAAGALPAGRIWGAAVYAPNVGRIYYFGGMNQPGAGAAYYDSIYEYDPVLDSGTMLATTLPLPLGKLGGAYWAGTGCIYLFGGMTTGDVETDKVVRFCPRLPAGGGGISALLTSTLAAGASGLGAVTSSSGIDLIGGVSGGAPLDLVQSYVPADDRVLTHGMRLPAAATYDVPTEQTSGVTVGLARNPASLFPTRIFPGTGPIFGVPGTDVAAPTPDPPSGTAISTGSTQVTWTINPVSDAAPGLAFLPYSFDNGATWRGSRNFDEIGLSANTQYTRTIKARDTLNNRTAAATITRYTVTNPPTGLGAVGDWDETDGYQVRLSWSPPAGGASSYRVRWSEDGYGSVQGSAAGLTFTRTGLTANTTYTFKVCGINPDGAEEPVCSASASATTPPALTWLTGLEGGTLGDADGGGAFDTATCGGASILDTDTSVVRSGSYSMKVAPSGGACFAGANIGAGPVAVARFALRFETLPAADVELFRQRASIGNDIHVGFNVASGKLEGAIGAQAQLSANSIEPGVWYVVNVRATLGSNPRQLDWNIDGVVQPQVSSAEAAGTVAQLRFGTPVSASYVAYFDDLGVSVTSTDYPLGYGKVVALRPDGVGTHSNAADFLDDDLTALDPASWLRVSDDPLGSVSDYIYQVNGNAGSYAELTLEDTPSVSKARAVRGITHFHRGPEAGGPASNGWSKIHRSDGTDVPLQDVHGVDWSGYPSLPAYDANMVYVPPGGWTPAQVNSLSARLGYATDVAPTPRWNSVMLEVEYGDFAPKPPSALAQYRADASTAIATGAWNADGAGTNVELRFKVNDNDDSQLVTPWVEVRPSGTPLSARCGASIAGVTFSGPAINAVTGGTDYTAAVGVSGLTRGTRYVWRACSVDQDGVRGSWTTHGGAPDFGVSNSPSVPALVSPADGTVMAGSDPILEATFADPDAADTGRISFQVCTTASCTDGGDPIRSGSSASGLASGVDGTWMVSPTLPTGRYYWRARNEDSSTLTSAWSATREIVTGSSTTLDTTACAGSAVEFGAQSLPLVATTTTDCAIDFATTFGTARLRIAQQDGTGRAMDGPGVILDYGEPGGSWAGTSMFGACMKSSTNASETWTAGPCGTSDGAWWHGVPSSASEVATAAAGPGGSVALRFGAKAPASLLPGAYSAALVVTVVAP